MPVYLAGRDEDIKNIENLFDGLMLNIPTQSVIFSGLRGVGKTVLINRNDLSDNERCYRYLQDKIAMNNQRFDMDTKVEKWGTLEKGVAIIYNQAFKELCKSGGFSDKAFLSWADRKGLIETQGGRMTKVKKVDGNPIRCVFLRLNDNIDKDGFEPVETMDKYEQEELPFK